MLWLCAFTRFPNTEEFGYRDPRVDRALLELAPVPSWHEVQFKRG